MSGSVAGPLGPGRSLSPRRPSRVVSSLCLRADFAAAAASTSSSPTFERAPSPSSSFIDFERIVVAEVACPQACAKQTELVRLEGKVDAQQRKIDAQQREIDELKSARDSATSAMLIRGVARECHRLVLEAYYKARSREPIKAPAAKGGRPREVEWLDVALDALRATVGDGAAKDLDDFATNLGLDEDRRGATYDIRHICNAAAHPDVRSFDDASLTTAVTNFFHPSFASEAKDTVALFRVLRAMS